LLAPRVGDSGGSLGAEERPLGVQFPCSIAGGDAFSFDGVPIAFVGDIVGVVELRSGDGEEGDSGLRNGEARGDPNASGEGLYGVETDMIVVAETFGQPP